MICWIYTQNNKPKAKYLFWNVEKDLYFCNSDKIIFMKRIILYLIICFCFLSCNNNSKQRTDTSTTKFEEEKIPLLASMVLSRIDRKDTIYNYVAHISYPTVLTTRDSLNVKPIYKVWQDELSAFVDSVTYIYNHKLHKKTSVLSFELSGAYEKDSLIYCDFDRKVYLATMHDTLKSKVTVVYNPQTETYTTQTIIK